MTAESQGSGIVDDVLQTAAQQSRTAASPAQPVHDGFHRLASGLIRSLWVLGMLVATGLFAGIVTLVIVTGLVLLIGATTGWLASFLGIGTHRFGASDLAVVTVDGKGKRGLIPSDGMAHWGPAWSPNDRRLVYMQGNPKTDVGPLVLADAHGGGRFVLTRDGREYA